MSCITTTSQIKHVQNEFEVKRKIFFHYFLLKGVQL